MATLNFPDEPDTGDKYTDSNSGFTYEWDGTVWKSSDPSTTSNIREIDNISSSFDGSETDFTLNVAANAVEPANPQSLIISVGGVMQNAGDDYTVSGSTITFTTAPTAGLTFFGTILGTALSLNTIADGTVSPGSLTTTSNYVMGGVTVDQAAGIVTAYQFKGDGSQLTGVASTDNIKTSTDAYFGANVSIGGSLTVQGTETIINVEELNVQDKTIGIGSTSTPTATTQDGAGAIIYGQTHIDILYDVDKAALGISTAVNVSGFVTATEVNATTRLVATAATVGSGVTINNTGIDVGIAAGIITAKEYYGDASNMTGAGSTLSASGFNPNPTSAVLSINDPVIGMYFNQGVKAGSGDITLRKDSASGTVVENFGVGSSITYVHGQATIKPTATLVNDQTYYVTVPDSAIQNMAGSSNIGAISEYYFNTLPFLSKLYAVGGGDNGQMGNGVVANVSKPIQIGNITTWSMINGYCTTNKTGQAIKNNGEFWTWGRAANGQTGLNNRTDISDPSQIPGSWSWCAGGAQHSYGIKTDGTLWSWGYNGYGQLGLADSSPQRSSPTQIGTGTDWARVSGYGHGGAALKTNGTFWTWGWNDNGGLGHNNATNYSSPMQVGSGTDWEGMAHAMGEQDGGHMIAVKTNGTLWTCGYNSQGQLGHINQYGGTGTSLSSPTQVGTDTTWSSDWWALAGGNRGSAAIKTDGTLWTWGRNGDGQLGQNNGIDYSSPKQVEASAGSGTWRAIAFGETNMAATTSKNQLWAWGNNSQGQLGQNNKTNYSSPRQVTPIGSYLGGIGGYVAGHSNSFSIREKSAQ